MLASALISGLGLGSMYGLMALGFMSFGGMTL